MIRHQLYSLALLLLIAAATQAADSIEGIGPKGEVTKVQGGFMFTEGPAADAKGRIYFSDIPADRVYRLEPDGKASIFREPSNHTNGSMFNSHGELVSCESPGMAPEWTRQKAASIDALATSPNVRAMRWSGAVHDVPLQWPALVAGLIKAAVADAADQGRTDG